MSRHDRSPTSAVHRLPGRGALHAGLAIGLALIAGLAGPGCATWRGRARDVRVMGAQPRLVVFETAARWPRAEAALDETEPGTGSSVVADVSRRHSDQSARGGRTSTATVPTDGPETGPEEVVLESPRIETEAAWDEVVISWNVEPADGAGVRVQARAEFAAPDTPTGNPSRWTRWYRLGDWSLDGNLPVRRTSVNGEADVDGKVNTDTLSLRVPARGLRIRITLLGALAREPRRLRWVTASFCDTNRRHEASRVVVGGRDRVLDVPQRSQVAYLDGKAWCSPTSISMVLGWWARQSGRPELDRDVPEVARGVDDPGWPGTGNWPFNTAYAASFRGMRACAARLGGMEDLVRLVDAGIPVVLSVNAPALRGKPVDPGNGHLVICVGFTEAGDVVVNDPWARLDEGQQVRRVYRREHVDIAWRASHRLAYLIAPQRLARAFPAIWK